MGRTSCFKNRKHNFKSLLAGLCTISVVQCLVTRLLGDFSANIMGDLGI